MFRKPLDLTGRRFGKLVAIEMLPEQKKGKCRKWLCRCDCGNMATVEVSQLTGGRIKTCGCSRTTDKVSDLTGKRYGMLTVISRKDDVHWNCRCDCGNELVASTYFLQKGRVTNCGCVDKVALEKKIFWEKHDCSSCAEKKECDKEFCKYEREFQK